MAELGPFSYFVILTMCAGFLLSLVALYSHIRPPKAPQKAWKFLGFFLLGVVFISGLCAATGYGLGMLEMSEAMAHVAPGKEEALLAHGQTLALVPVKIALGNGISLAIGVFSLVRGL